MWFKRIIICLIGLSCSFLFSAEQDATVFYIVRHGQTDWNVEKRIQGCSDIPLNANGKAQAAALKEALDQISFAYCYSSDMSRAKETAQIILGSDRSIDVQLDPRLRERNFGPWEGRLSWEFDDSIKREGKIVESDETMRERAVQCLNEIATRHGGSHILVATHAGVMRNLIAEAFSVAAPEEIHVDNMALLTLEICDGQMHIGEMQGIDVPKKL